jgi:hypothetical protein
VTIYGRHLGLIWDLERRRKVEDEGFCDRGRREREREPCSARLVDGDEREFKSCDRSEVWRCTDLTSLLLL